MSGSNGGPPLAAFWAAVLVALLPVQTASGQSRDAVANDLLHSDLPVFGHGRDNEWPQPFHDEDSIGCTSRVAFGDWVFQGHGADDRDDPQWYRFGGPGMFHCRATTSRASGRAGLDGADSRPSFFVRLGNTRVVGNEIELWTVQMGARPGSEYLLLSRRPGNALIEQFDVLQSSCPAANVRDAGAVGMLLTRYCVVRSDAELLRLARRMAQRPILGTLERAPPVPGPEDDGGSDPDH